MLETLAFLFFLFLPSALLSPSISVAHDLKGIFVFGSSLVDNGNNNFLGTLARADYPPYGLDFRFGPTGRFTNGRNAIDLIAEQLEFTEHIPVFHDSSTNGPKIVHGVDFASGGSGILDETGKMQGNVISMNQQIRNFEGTTLPELEAQLKRKGDEILADYLFVVGVGGNDYTMRYSSIVQKNGTDGSDEAFASILVSRLTQQLKWLNSLGARKFVLMAIYPNGCSPSILAKELVKEGCVEWLNDVVSMFNARLRKLADESKDQLLNSQVVVVDCFNIIRDIIKSPDAQGFVNVKGACCEVSEQSRGALCRRGGSVCKNRNEYVYFDGLHPTENVNVLIATKGVQSNLTEEVYPYNIQKLAEM